MFDTGADILNLIPESSPFVYQFLTSVCFFKDNITHTVGEPHLWTQFSVFFQHALGIEVCYRMTRHFSILDSIEEI